MKDKDLYVSDVSTDMTSDLKKISSDRHHTICGLIACG